ncbi:hypothetical protein GGF43_000701 [Coemansia sp. RSA 2618]|nr:hypothetical protein GGF43_000701 [Coemansia sp. RSA 2618]
MTSTLQFTAISGAHSEDAVCYLLEIDEARILLDCGSYEGYSGEGLARLQRIAPRVDAVLLSHPDMAHVGAYPLAYSQYGLTCPAYATQATHMMGALCMQDVTKTLVAREEFTLFSEKDVEAAFENVTPLQYSQPKALAGRHAHIVITAHAAGHTIGGTIWTISNGAENVLYALDYNHTKEEHLRPCSLMEGAEGLLSRRLMKPTLLIADALNATHNLPTRKKRVECFLDSVGAVVKSGGNVLIPVDSAARVLEIAYVLNEWWRHERGLRDTHALCLLGGSARKVRSFAQSLVGWMASDIESKMSTRDTKPFDLRHVAIVQNMDELEHKTRGNTRTRGRRRPAVVLAPLEGMSMGFSQELFLRWAGDENNAIVLPQRGPPGSLARDLFSRWWDHTQAGREPDSPMRLGSPVRLPNTRVTVTVKRRVPLKGAELDAWTAQERRRKEEEAARDAMLKRKRDMLDDDVSSDSDSDGEAAGRIGGMAAEAISEVDLATERLLSGQTYDLHIGGRAPARGLSTGQYMFPFQEKNRRADDYGEIYDVDEYAVKVENDDAGMMLDIDADEEAEDAEPEKPTKPVVKERRVKVNCQVAFVDMEGRVSGNSLRNILVNLIPKRLVLVHGSSASTRALADFCRDPSVHVTKDVYAPSVGEILNVSSGINAYQVQLADALFKKVHMAGLRGSTVGFVGGRIHYAQDAQVPTLDFDAAGLDNAWQPPVLVGDPRLSALRSALEKHGITTFFDSEATLVCNSAVAIKRAASRRSGADCIRILGNPTPDFYRIRALVNEYLIAI